MISGHPPRSRGRPRLYPGSTLDEEQIRLALPGGAKDRIAAVLKERESVQAFIRTAIEREIARRLKRP